MARQIYTLQEPNSTIQKLHRAGLTQVRDICRLTPDQLAAAAHLPVSEASSLLQRAARRPALTAGRPRPPPGHVVTFSRRLDALLGGGLPLGRLTELVAPPGGGKTQLCLQACVDATLPAELGGLSAVSLFVDTEDSPIAARLHSLASAASVHCRRVALTGGDDAARRAADAFSVETVLRRVRVIRAATATDVLLLPAVLAGLMERDGVRLVCLDSVAAPWRGGDAAPRRAQDLQWLAGELRRLARRHAAAVVVTNHATTLLEPAGASLAPALGASWQHCAAVRLWLDVRGEARVARLLKHPERPDGEAAFQILEVGIRDVYGAVGDDGGDVGEGGEDSEEEDADAEDGHRECDAIGSGDPGDSPAEAIDCGAGDGTGHVTKQESDVTGHVTKQESDGTGHVTKQESDVTGHVTKQETDATDGAQSKRRKVL